jgi:hypothetical protein
MSFDIETFSVHADTVNGAVGAGRQTGRMI